MGNVSNEFALEKQNNSKNVLEQKSRFV